MVINVFPRAHARYTSLPLLGPELDDFVDWLVSQGYPEIPIQRRVRRAPVLDSRLRRGGFRDFSAISREELFEFVPAISQTDVYLSALVRSLAVYFEGRDVFVCPQVSPGEQLVTDYCAFLGQVRGLVTSTVTSHSVTAAALLGFIGFDGDHSVLRQLNVVHIEAFVKSISLYRGRASLQHKVAQVRSFLRFLAGRGNISHGLDLSIDTPRVYRGEKLPRSLPWETVEAFLAAIDRTTSIGRRDFAMFLLITTYGLRTSEVTALQLDDIEWRAGRLTVPRPKTRTPIVLPLTEEVGAAIIDYVRHARPELAHRELFLRVRAPAGPLAATAVSEAFQRWSRAGKLGIPYQGPHCLRHSLAVHLLRQGTSLKAIGDLLGHRSAESTCVYLRLHVDDLRDAALELPIDEELAR